MCYKSKMLVIGGDLRQIYCGRRLCDKYDVFVMGFDDELLPVADKLPLFFRQFFNRLY